MLRIFTWIIQITLQSVFLLEHSVCVQCTHKRVERVDPLTIDRAYHSLQHNGIVHIMCTLEIDDARHGVFTYALSDCRVSANTTEWKRHECPGEEWMQCFLPLHPTKAPLDTEKAPMLFASHIHEFATPLGGIASHSERLRSLSPALRFRRNWIAKTR